MLSVIIGRFQTPLLHAGHLDLLKSAKKAADLLVLIGTTSAIGTDKNPLSFEVRKQLFDCLFSTFPILPLEDAPSDKDWSDRIDNIISDLGYEKAIIWAGRDNSVKGYYCGKHEVKIIDQIDEHSSTKIRKEISTKLDSYNSIDFRAGIIHHIENRYPIVYSTVDVAICYYDPTHENFVLMGKKGDKFNFIGGFVDSADEDLKTAAYRELKEETGLSCGLSENIKYLTHVFSKKVEDARYKGTKDSIMTHFFIGEALVKRLPDPAKISDKEFKEFAWIPASEKSLELISEAHKPLFLKFINSKN